MTCLAGRAERPPGPRGLRGKTRVAGACERRPRALASRRRSRDAAAIPRMTLPCSRSNWTSRGKHAATLEQFRVARVDAGHDRRRPGPSRPPSRPAGGRSRRPIRPSGTPAGRLRYLSNKRFSLPRQESKRRSDERKERTGQGAGAGRRGRDSGSCASVRWQESSGRQVRGRGKAEECDGLASKMPFGPASIRKPVAFDGDDIPAGMRRTFPAP